MKSIVDLLEDESFLKDVVDMLFSFLLQVAKKMVVSILQLSIFCSILKIRHYYLLLQICFKNRFFW